MPLAPGTELYRIGSRPCSGEGRSWTSGELDGAILNGPVTEVLLDDEGKGQVRDLLSRVSGTEFEETGLRSLLNAPAAVEDWRVSEAIAEAYLSSHRDCFFPWPHSRDTKSVGASLPGADLVGFGRDSSGDCFAFGEVKSSSEKTHPPRVMYSTHGLTRQLEDLRDKAETRATLFMYLAQRAPGQGWKSQFENATIRFLKDPNDVQIFGFLVRDVAHSKSDLRHCVKQLCSRCPAGMSIEVLALYLPQGRLAGIGVAAVTSRRGGVS